MLFAVLMLAIGAPLDPSVYLPVVAGWLIAGVVFVWWLHHSLARRDKR